MKPSSIPAGYQQIMPYLIIKNAGTFMQFMKTVFDATEKMVAMRDEHIIMHGELTIGDCCIMFADATDDFSQQTAGMFIYVDDCDARYQKAVENGATAIMPPANQQYGRSAGIKDLSGNTWWITTA